MKSQHRIILLLLSYFGMAAIVEVQVATAQVTGSGTTNYMSKWSGTSALGNSSLFDNGAIGMGTTSPNFAGYGGWSRVFTINSGGQFGLGVLELATDRVPTDEMEIGDVAVTLLNNTIGYRRISRLLTLSAGYSANNQGGHLSFQTKQDGISSWPAERMRITDAGNVGIGTSYPTSMLTVAGIIQSTTGGIKFPDGTVQTTASTGGGGWATSGTNIYNTNTGSVGIGISAPTTRLHVVANGTEAATFERSDAGRAGVTIKAATSQQAAITMNDGANAKWRLGKETNNSFFIFDVVNNRNAVSLGTDGNMYVQPAGGRVGIGTTNIGATTMLAVEGKIGAREVNVMATGNVFPDYVFDEDYALTPLPDLERTIKTSKHLPGVPSASDVKKNGIDVGTMQITLLKKVEELTLYVIDQNKKLSSLEKENALLKARVSKLDKSSN